MGAATIGSRHHSEHRLPLATRPPRRLRLKSGGRLLFYTSTRPGITRIQLRLQGLPGVVYGQSSGSMLAVPTPGWPILSAGAVLVMALAASTLVVSLR